MAQPTAKSEAGTSEATPQTMNLTDRTASRQRAPSIQSDSDPTSSSGSSSEDSESESEDEQQSDREVNGTGNSTTQTNTDSLPHIGGRPKPRIRRFKGGSGLMSRLNAFLPQMKSANEDLQRQIDAGNAGDLVLDNAEANGERYIEMVCWRKNCIDEKWLMRFRTLVSEFWKRSAMASRRARRAMPRGAKMWRMILILLESSWVGRRINPKVISHPSKR